jgi:hypothetical protein
MYLYGPILGAVIAAESWKMHQQCHAVMTAPANESDKRDDEF